MLHGLIHCRSRFRRSLLIQRRRLSSFFLLCRCFGYERWLRYRWTGHRSHCRCQEFMIVFGGYLVQTSPVVFFVSFPDTDGRVAGGDHQDCSLDHEDTTIRFQDTQVVEYVVADDASLCISGLKFLTSSMLSSPGLIPLAAFANLNLQTKTPSSPQDAA